MMYDIIYTEKAKESIIQPTDIMTTNNFDVLYLFKLNIYSIL